MNLIRKVLFTILSIEAYLKFISKIYVKLILKGRLQNEYPEIHFLKSFIKNGNVCIDIGANLGYYSSMISKLVGSQGHVYAIEPIPLFGDIWKQNVKQSKIENLTLFPFALGKEESVVQMGIPEKNGVLHHGMTKITSTASENYVKLFDVEMKNPDVLFNDINKIDFIKCDVEGYEHVVFSNMVDTIKKHKPFIQSELSGLENRKAVIELLESLNYKTYFLYNGELKPASENDRLTLEQDFYFAL